MRELVTGIRRAILAPALGALLVCTNAAAVPDSITVLTEDNVTGLMGRAQGRTVNNWADLVCAVARRAQIDCTIQVLPWARVLKLSEVTPDVVVAPIARTPERETSFIWGGRGAVLHQGLYAFRQRNLPPVRTIADLKNLRIGVIRDDYRATYLQSLGLTEGSPGLDSSNTLEAVIRKLEADRIDVFPVSEGVLPQVCANFQIDCKELVLIYPLDQLTRDVYFAFSKNTNPVLVERMMHAWGEMNADGTTEREFGSIINPRR